MPVKPNVLERLLLYRLGRAPVPILDLVGAGGLRAVVAAADLAGVYDLGGVGDPGDTTDADAASPSDASPSGDGYDLALVFNVVHARSPGENRDLIARVADALAPGGRILVMDQFEGDDRGHPPAAIRPTTK